MKWVRYTLYIKADHLQLTITVLDSFNLDLKSQSLILRKHKYSNNFGIPERNILLHLISHLMEFYKLLTKVLIISAT